MMPEDPRPSDPKPVEMSPLVDWMSRHGVKLFAALVVVELLFHAYTVGVLSTGKALPK